MLDTKKIDNQDLNLNLNEKNIKNFQNILDEYQKDIILKLYYQKIYQLYQKEYYQNPKGKIDYQKMQTLFQKMGENISKKNIEATIFPTIEFKNEKIYIEEIKKIAKKYQKEHSERMSILLAIQEFLNKHINYPFFLAFSIDNTNKQILNFKITKNDLLFLEHIIQNDKDLDKNDKYLNLFLKKIKNGTKQEIKIFLINNFSKFSKQNQEIFLKYFHNIKKDINGNYLYSYIGNTNIEDIIKKYKIGDCTHISLIAKHLFNKIYDGKEAKILYIVNPIINHAYNVLVVNTNEGYRFIYIDFLGDRKKILEDYGKHNFDIIVK